MYTIKYIPLTIYVQISETCLEGLFQIKQKTQLKTIWMNKLWKTREKSHSSSECNTALGNDDMARVCWLLHGLFVLRNRDYPPVNRICNLSISSELPTHLSYTSLKEQERTLHSLQTSQSWSVNSESQIVYLFLFSESNTIVCSGLLYASRSPRVTKTAHSTDTVYSEFTSLFCLRINC